jgi:hypothetical protein
MWSTHCLRGEWEVHRTFSARFLTLDKNLMCRGAYRQAPLQTVRGLPTLHYLKCGPHASNSRRDELPSQQELSVLRSQANKTYDMQVLPQTCKKFDLAIQKILVMSLFRDLHCICLSNKIYFMVNSHKNLHIAEHFSRDPGLFTYRTRAIHSTFLQHHLHAWGTQSSNS